MNILRLTSNLSLLESPTAESDGLWQTYDGTALIMEMGDEIRALYIDLNTLTIPENPPALEEHDREKHVGWWSDSHTKIDSDNGLALAQRLHLLRSKTSEHPTTEAHWRAAATRHLLESGMPLQASVCVQPNPNGGADAKWQQVTEPTIINGRRIDPANHLPLPTYVLRHGLNRETSMCIMGEAVSTGKIAASLKAAAGLPSDDTPPQTQPPSAANTQETSTMDIKERMAALLTEHGEDHKTSIMEMMIDGKTDEEITAAITAAMDQAKDQEIADLKASLKASQDENEAIKASLKSEQDKVSAHAAEISTLKASRQTPPAASGVAAGQVTASLRRSKMTQAERVNYAANHGPEALAALPF